MSAVIFDKHIQLKSMSCAHGHCRPQPISKAVNIFVKVTDSCNARCAFCSNSGIPTCNTQFNHDKLWKIVDELRDKDIRVNRINITGGEPATVPLLVNIILEAASASKYKDIHFHLNTNGLLPSSQNLIQHPRWDSISMSLHHYDKEKLSEIYGVQISDTAFAFDGVNMDIVNASCNLIKGYIDSDAEVERMLKFAISLGLPRLGFVALMKVNEYCREHYIDIDDINFSAIPHLYFTESRFRGTDCTCSNYLYNHNGKILEIYMRNYSNPNYCESSLLYDGQFLRQGFHDDNIIF